jgi:TfoX/Sxy family transcriptional regulator of competence genes
MRKAPEALIKAFGSAVPEVPSVERRTMFGYPCAFVGGNMFCGVYEDRIVVRVSDARREAAMRAGARPFEPMPGRPMRNYLEVPPAVVSELSALREWLSDALAYTATLPRKQKPKAKGAKSPARAQAKNGGVPRTAKATAKKSPKARSRAAAAGRPKRPTSTPRATRRG